MNYMSKLFGLGFMALAILDNADGVQQNPRGNNVPHRHAVRNVAHRNGRNNNFR